jgi:hypothetical protein
MKTIIKCSILVLLFTGLLSACTTIPQPELPAAPQPTEEQETQMVVLTPTEVFSSSVPAEEAEREFGVVHALTEKLTLESTSEEISEKMLSSFLNWQTLEVEADNEYSSLNPDDSVAYTIKHHVSTWIDQERLRYRSEEKQPETDILPKLIISDGKVSVNRGGETLVEGYPLISNPTTVSPVTPSVTLDNAIDLMHSGDTIFPPMGDIYGGKLGSQIFSSSYAVQYPGEYQAVAIEMIAGREMLKVFYEDADRWGRSNIKHTLWIDVETGVVLKAWSDGKPDHFTSGMEVTHIIYNPQLDDGLFTIDEAMPDLDLMSMQSKMINDINLYVGQLYVEDEKLKVQACFDLPSTADWMLYGFRFNGIGAAGLELSLNYLERAGTLQEKGLRCDTLIFPETLPIGDVHLEIDQVQALPREGTFCEMADIVQNELDAEARGIRFTCIEDYGTTIQIDEKPQGMSEEEAQNEVFTLLHKRNTPIIEGPWVFDLALQEE